ncbi:hypothetical protein DPMN_159325 [Dreissena polymorpha]|uniref:TNFR-Cys domain-containing protein n=1 Tax=Dreissena polymorpha TaxID=45954 RepID=A0A9D4EKJ6_DREPO|nr:hypothetical protein DPMN_159325 [Dreissena polymorpha]
MIFLCVVTVHICFKWTYALVPYINVRRCPYRSFYDASGSEGNCRACKICSKGYQTREPCSANFDTVCEACSPGTYNDVIGGTCMACSACVSGEYVRNRCKPHKDTKCRRCPRHTFSLNGNFSVCRQCKRCNKHEKQLLPCKRKHDRVCGGCKKGYFRFFGGGCLRCSKCLNKNSAVVRECANQKQNEPDQVCWPVAINNET